MSTSAWIDVERKEGLRDRARAYRVMIDGRKRARSGTGVRRASRSRPGTHEVFLKID